jgi:beta-mannosidase
VEGGRIVLPLSGDVWKLGEGPAPSNWIPATVPGNVQEALWRAGLKPDSYFGTDADAHRDTETKTWVYERAFSFTRDHTGIPWTLELNGVDHAARSTLNGTVLSEHEGAFGALRVPHAEKPAARSGAGVYMDLHG